MSDYTSEEIEEVYRKRRECKLSSLMTEESVERQYRSLRHLEALVNVFKHLNKDARAVGEYKPNQ